MSVQENDWDLLEEYLDGELTEAAAMALRARLGAEPELSAALASAQAQRGVRAAMFAGMEGDSAAVERVLAGVLSTGQPPLRLADGKRSFTLGKSIRALRWVAALAACIVIGFFLGRLPATSPTPPSIPATPAEAPHGYQVSVTDGAGKVLAVKTFDSLQKAQDFARDLDAWQQRQQVLQNGQPVQVADRF